MEVTISCLCGQSEQTITLAADRFPIDASLDHSNAARYSTGMLFASYLPLVQPPPDHGRWTEYNLSQDVSCLFCDRCSCHLLLHSNSSDEYGVASGVLQHDGDIIKIVEHQGVGETLDGGAVTFIEPPAQPQSWTLREATGRNQMLRRDAERPSRKPQPLETAGEKLLAECHCGGVQFFVTPPNPQSEKLSSPWPDVLVPYHSGNSVNHEDSKWWLRADKTKYLASLCACKSCRMSSGFPIQAWAFIPKTNLRGEGGESFHMDSGCLKRFESSLGVYRESCKTCGATVFWHSDERPDLIDVSVGLLRAPDGARAETILEWDRRRVSFIEDALDQQLAAALQVS
jgi:hypothetical protein